MPPKTWTELRKKSIGLSLDEAEAIGFRALAFLAEDPARLGRFLALTGMRPDQLREEAASPANALAVLDHLMGDESLLLVFAANAGMTPEAVASAYRLLSRAVEGERGE